MNFFKAAWAAVSGWFGGLDISLIECGLVAAGFVAWSIFMYHAGVHSRDAGIAEDNAKVALIYAKNVKSANDAAEQERSRAEALAKENTDLKEQVKHVANGDASPGVDAATHGMRPTAPARKVKLPHS